MTFPAFTQQGLSQLLAQLSHAHVGREFQTAVRTGLLRARVPCFRSQKFMVKDDAKDQDSPPCNGAMAFSLKGYRKDLTKKSTALSASQRIILPCCTSQSVSKLRMAWRGCTASVAARPWRSSAPKRSCRSRSALAGDRLSNHTPSPNVP